MTFLAHYHNMSTYHFGGKHESGGRDYLLEINPHYVEGGLDDELNAVDARWIDMYSGLFIDISALSRRKGTLSLPYNSGFKIRLRHTHARTSLPHFKFSMPIRSPRSLPGFIHGRVLR